MCWTRLPPAFYAQRCLRFLASLLDEPTVGLAIKAVQLNLQESQLATLHSVPSPDQVTQWLGRLDVAAA